MRAPDFWSLTKPNWQARLLTPLSWGYRALSFLDRFFTIQRRVSVPVVCVGNITVGGAGKTPTTLEVAKTLRSQGKKVAVISRGYKGSFWGAVKVDPAQHTASQVGDEPLLISRSVETWVSKNRYKGAKAAIAGGAEVIVLDDGLQNRKLKHDLKLCVVDSLRGFGNGCVLPAGPLRETIACGMKRVDALVVLGAVGSLESDKPILKGTVVVNKEDWSKLQGKEFVAFAGLAYPDKFFKTLRDEKIRVKETVSFPDHHAYTSRDLKSLLKKAKAHNVGLVTTEKDWVRLPKDMQKKVSVLRIQVDFKNSAQVARVLKPVLV